MDRAKQVDEALDSILSTKAKSPFRHERTAADEKQKMFYDSISKMNLEELKISEKTLSNMIKKKEGKKLEEEEDKEDKEQGRDIGGFRMPY